MDKVRKQEADMHVGKTPATTLAGCAAGFRAERLSRWLRFPPRQAKAYLRRRCRPRARDLPPLESQTADRRASEKPARPVAATPRARPRLLAAPHRPWCPNWKIFLPKRRVGDHRDAVLSAPGKHRVLDGPLL